jgi:alpha-tubulin suppressor-like RCC1 family protein
MRTHLPRWILVALAAGVGLATALGPGGTPPAAAARTLTITAGYAHTCALLSNGTARCWGDNTVGQLGDGTSGTNRLTPVAVSGLSNAVAIDAGGGYGDIPSYGHTCAVLSDGTARCWGNNDYGQLGDGTSGTERDTPVAVSGLSNAVAISAGYHHTCAVLSDGTAKCWGDDTYGQLGDGTTGGYSLTPVAVFGLSNAVAISAGDYHTCALLSDGTARCWGANAQGQLGDNSITPSPTPVAVFGLSNAVAISAGYYHTCALLGDGTAQCWGRNSSGQLGNDSMTPSPTPVAVCAEGPDAPCTAGNNNILTGAVAISAGGYHTCAVLSDGSAMCWGYNTYGQVGDGTSGSNRLTPVAVCAEGATQPCTAGNSNVLTSAVAITAGRWHTCALLDDGTAKCWGWNSGGQVGDGTSGTNRLTPVAVFGLAYALAPAITAGFRHTCIVLGDGTARCWGDNTYGQLGDGTTTERHTPVPVCAEGATAPCTAANNILTGAVAISAGYEHTCALLSDGTTFCWGHNNHGQLGDDFAELVSATPVAVSGLSDAVAIASGDYHTCALLSDGTAMCWGDNYYGQLGDGTTSRRDTPVAVCASGSGPGCSGGAALGGVVAISAGSYHTCALLSDGTARCWGNNVRGQLGDGTTTERHTPVAVCASGSGPGCSGGAALGGVVTISAGDYHTCALLSDGTARCWGDNTFGQLGDGTAGTHSTTPAAVSGLSNVVAIAGGYGHTCAVLNDGTARCWGWNDYGQLGDGASGTNRLTPVAVSGLGNAVAIAAGYGHTCALLSNGTSWCWGSNAFGQLGDGTTTDHDTPVTVGPTPTIAAGYQHTCGVLNDGSAWCWGWNYYGQLGNGMTGGISATPSTVSGLTNAVAISAANSHTCAVLRDGTAWCWGDNVLGQLGNGSVAPSNTPVQVSGLTNAVAIAAGYYHSCALLSDGTARCWGQNTLGQLGDGTTTGRLAPVAVSGLSNAVAISAGDWYTCALLSDGTARCWGYNNDGQLGNGTTTEDPNPTPVAVSGLSNAVAIDAGGYAGTGHTCALLSDGTARCWGWNYYGQLGNNSTTDSPTPVAVSGLTNAVAVSAGGSHTCALLGNGSASCWGWNGNGQLGNGITGGISTTPSTVSGLTNAVAISAGSLHTCALLSDGTAGCWGYNTNGQLGDGSTTDSDTPVGPDNDSDGLIDTSDNCRFVPNPGQENSDAAIDNGPGITGDDTTVPNGDSLGDACDPDMDNDGLPNSEDTNPLGATGICAAFAGASDGHPNPTGGDVTNDDDHNGDPAPPMGTDASDNGPSWDTDGDGVLDGVECTLGHNPRSRTDRPTIAECGGSGDTDGDGLLNAWETCGWGTSPTAVDTDGDGKGDCKEAADVDGNGKVDFVGDTIYYAKAALLPAASFGKTMDFDIDKNGKVDFVGDVIQEAKFALINGLCK